jgi:hypothetical protein
MPKKFKNPYLKVIKGRIVPANEFEKRQIRIQRHNHCNKINGWLDHQFTSLSYHLIECMEHKFSKSKPNNSHSSDFHRSSGDNDGKRSNINKGKFLDLTDNISLLGDLFIVGSISIDQESTSLTEKKQNSYLNSNFSSFFNHQKNKSKSFVKISKIFRLNLHKIDKDYEINVRENRVDSETNNRDDRQKITFAYLFGDSSLFASFDQDDDALEEDMIGVNIFEDMEFDEQSFTVDFSSIIGNSDSEEEKEIKNLSYDITSL